MADENKTEIKKPTIPAHLAQALKNAESNQAVIRTSLEKMNLKDFDDAVALRNIERILDITKRMKSDRYERRNNKKSTINITRDYEVIEMDSALTKKASKILKNIRLLQESNINSIQQNFIQNKYDAVKNILDTNVTLINEVDNVFTVLLKVLNTKMKNGQFDKNSILLEVIKHFGEDEILNLLKPVEELKKTA